MPLSGSSVFRHMIEAELEQNSAYWTVELHQRLLDDTALVTEHEGRNPE